MKFINLSINNIIRNYLGRLLAKPNHLNWLNALLCPLKQLWEGKPNDNGVLKGGYYNERMLWFLEGFLSPQTIHLEKHLNDMFDYKDEESEGQHNRIKIEEYRDKPIYTYRPEEISMGIITIEKDEEETVDETFMQQMTSLKGEFKIFNFLDFVVRIPTQNFIHSKETIQQEVNKIKAGGFTYSVLYSNESPENAN